MSYEGVIYSAIPSIFLMTRGEKGSIRQSGMVVEGDIWLQAAKDKP
jgi:hypothetical protein